MKRLRKILAILLLPMMIISLSGAELHFHFCEYSGEFHADMHFPELNSEGDLQTCCSSEEEQTCCNDNCTRDFQKEACCTDFEKQIVTDKNYKFSFYTYNSEVKGLKLNDFFLPAQLFTFDQNILASEELPVYITSPHLSKIQLLL